MTMAKVINLNDARRERHETADAIAHLEGVSMANLLGEIGRRVDALVARAPGRDADGLQLLTADDAAALLTIPKGALYELARRQQLGSVRDGRSVRFTRAQIAEYQRQRTIAAR